MRLFLSKILFLFAYFAINVNFVHNDCGAPGHSMKSKLKNIENQKRAYFKDNETVEYLCDDNDNEFLIGPSIRTCKNGRWTDNYPLCAINYIDPPQFPWKVNAFWDRIMFDLGEFIPIAGCKVIVLSTDKDISIKHIDLEKPKCIKKITEQSMGLYNYKNEFICYSKAKSIKSTKRFTVKFNKNIKENCDANGCKAGTKADIGPIDIFYIKDDRVCGEPDLKLNLEIIKTKHENSKTTFTLKCDDDKQNEQNLICDTSGAGYWDLEFSDLMTCSSPVKTVNTNNGDDGGDDDDSGLSIMRRKITKQMSQQSKYNKFKNH